MEFVWVGDDEEYLDDYSVKSLGKVSVGCFGGGTKFGATKNEDAAYILQHPDGVWVFAVLLDAHHSSDSASAIIRLLESKYENQLEGLNPSDEKGGSNFDTLFGRQED